MLSIPFVWKLFSSIRRKQLNRTSYEWNRSGFVVQIQFLFIQLLFCGIMKIEKSSHAIFNFQEKTTVKCIKWNIMLFVNVMLLKLPIHEITNFMKLIKFCRKVFLPLWDPHSSSLNLTSIFKCNFFSFFFYWSIFQSLSNRI